MNESIRYTCTIHEMATDERPRERLMRLGPGACSSSELLAILLRTGSSERSALGLADELIRHFGGLRGAVNASIEEMQRVKGELERVEVDRDCGVAVELGKRLAIISREISQIRHRHVREMLPTFLCRSFEMSVASISKVS